VPWHPQIVSAAGTRLSSLAWLPRNATSNLYAASKFGLRGLKSIDAVLPVSRANDRIAAESRLGFIQKPPATTVGLGLPTPPRR